MGVKQTQAQEMEKYEIANFEYTMIPSAGDVQWNAYHLNAGYGISLLENHEVGIAVSYENTVYSFFDTPSLNTNSFEEIHTIKTGIFYRYNISNSWEFKGAFSPVISAILNKAIENEDIQYAWEALLSKTCSKEDRSIGVDFGLLYGAFFGKPKLYPTINLFGTYGNWNYKLGFPETHINYQIDNRHQLKFGALFQGSYSNISNEINFSGVGSFTNSKLAYRALDFVLRHAFRLQPSITSIVKLGYLSENSLELLDKNDNGLMNFNTGGSVYVTMGLTLNLNY